MPQTRTNREAGPRSRIAFTLVELLVVVSIIALLISILLPSLKKARQQAKSVVCLSNLKSMGTGVMTYSGEYNGVICGPLHPAVYRNQTVQYYLDRGYSESWATYFRSRQITWKLHTTLGQKFEGAKSNVTDDIATCPVLAGIVPDSWFETFKKENYWVFPTHYVLNNSGDFLTEGEASGHTGNARVTSPQYYFGYSPPALPENWSDLQKLHVEQNPPRPLARIRRTSDEWMIADAWYRDKSSSFKEFQQEGPYQSGWSGLAFPHFAPHFKPGRRAPILDDGDRSVQASLIRQHKSDGKTNAVYFDAHAGPAKSKTLKANGFELLYGFQGTVNPRLSTDQVKEVWKLSTWE